MSAHAAVEIRLLDPGGDSLVFTWQIRDGRDRVLGTGEVAGAPNTPELAGWRYQAFAEAAEIAINALKGLEAAGRLPAAGGQRARRRCDFCASALAVWRYPVQPRRALTVWVDDGIVLLPGGDWYACPACHLLVEAGEWVVLSEWAHLPASQGEVLWAAFRASRAGPAVPYQGDADA